MRLRGVIDIDKRDLLSHHGTFCFGPSVVFLNFRRRRGSMSGSGQDENTIRFKNLSDIFNKGLTLFSVV